MKRIPEEYGNFLCKKAQVLALTGGDGLSSLRHAEDIAAEMEVAPGSGLGRLLQETRLVLGTR